MTYGDFQILKLKDIMALCCCGETTAQKIKNEIKRNLV